MTNYLQPNVGEIVQWTAGQEFTNSLDDKYEYITDSYTGEGYSKTGKYLERHPKESVKKFSARQARSYYQPYVKSIIDSIITPVFAKPAIRETNNTFFEEFIKNCDVKGTSLGDFTKDMVKFVRLHGVSFAIMDNFQLAESDEKTVLEQRAFPYIYMKTANEVECYTTDKFGRLESITFDYGETAEGEELYIKIDATNVQLLLETNDGWTPYSTATPHGLTKIPVVRLSLEHERILPYPSVFDMAAISQDIYNKASEQRNLERNCAWPVITMQAKDYNNEVDLGEDSILIYGGDTEGSITAPSWISPDVNILKVLDELNTNLVQKLVDIARQNGAIAINTGQQAKSGVALALEFAGASYKLIETASLAESFELAVADLFALFMNSNFDYNVKYTSEFLPSVGEVLLKIDMIEKATSVGLTFDQTELEKLKNLILSSL